MVKRLSYIRGVSLVSLMATIALSACQTTTTGPAPELEKVAEVPGDGAPAAEPAQPTPLQPQPEPEAEISVSSSDFIGKPAGSLEQLIGEPAFMRKEMAGEFRRYDLGDCRVYAVIAPNGDGRPVIGSLSISSQAPGQQSVSLQQCLAAL